MDANERKIGNSEYGQHEALHVAYLMEDMFERYLLNHPAVKIDAKLHQRAREAHKVLFDMYQAIGSRNFSKAA
jgi:hypothetical protein